MFLLLLLLVLQCFYFYFCFLSVFGIIVVTQILGVFHKVLPLVGFNKHQWKFPFWLIFLSWLLSEYLWIKKTSRLEFRKKQKFGLETERSRYSSVLTKDQSLGQISGLQYVGSVFSLDTDTCRLTVFNTETRQIPKLNIHYIRPFQQESLRNASIASWLSDLSLFDQLPLSVFVWCAALLLRDSQVASCWINQTNAHLIIMMDLEWWFICCLQILMKIPLHEHLSQNL